MRAEILNQEGNVITVQLFDELTPEEVAHYKIGDRLFARVELFDPDSITVDQRKHIYALFGDMEAYTGYPRDWWERFMKEGFMHYDLMDEMPSLATNAMSKTRAAKFTEFIIIYCIQNEIPFRKQQFYLPQESSKVIFYLTMNRMCVVCGKPHAHIHHFDTVGMGRDRRKVDHTKHRVMALCPRHHSETHDIGVRKFYEKYQVKPVVLNRKQLKELGM